MKFKVKDMNIATGGVRVVLMNHKEAFRRNLAVGDRFYAKRNTKEIVAVLDLAYSDSTVPAGKLGLFEETLADLGAKNGDDISIRLAGKPKSLHFIKQKLNGHRLTPEQIQTIVKDIVSKNLTDVEITYFVAGCYTRGLDMPETVALTKAMIKTGDVLNIGCYPVIDKHCIGGVAGNRTTMVVIPMLTAAGYCIPKTSSRSITSPAGTADTMEVLANVSLTTKEIMKVIKKAGACMVWGGAVNLAPADDDIINVEHPLSIDAEGNLLASIMAKKGSVSATHVMIDIPVGIDAKIESRKEARHLKKQFEKLGKYLNMKIEVKITDGSEPIGNGIGPALEARDVLWLLSNDPRAPQDLRKKAVYIASEIFRLWPLTGKPIDDPRGYAEYILDSGKAMEAMRRIIEAQGKKITDHKKIKLAKHSFDYKSRRKGAIRHMCARTINCSRFTQKARPSYSTQKSLRSSMTGS
ncbi:thymidine phosphorylase [Candidatus Woesearchaeota archaeon]|nr:thymidine phosphorylase [Candidatus Woesearchaeota archaeon]